MHYVGVEGKACLGHLYTNLTGSAVMTRPDIICIPPGAERQNDKAPSFLPAPTSLAHDRTLAFQSLAKLFERLLIRSHSHPTRSIIVFSLCHSGIPHDFPSKHAVTAKRLHNSGQLSPERIQR